MAGDTSALSAVHDENPLYFITNRNVGEADVSQRVMLAGPAGR
jgi:hypothetical protein